MLFFLNYNAIWGLSAFLPLLLIYHFKRRSRAVRVSSLMFFPSSKIPAEGGLKLTILQMPLILLVEILILALLILAIANPVICTSSSQVPLVLILDDSYSMLAVSDTDSKNSQQRALEYIRKHIFSKKYYRVTLVLAGDLPEIVGEYDMRVEQARLHTEHWKCLSNISNLSRAIEFVKESFKKNVSIVVITDSLLERESGNYDSGLLWLAFGKPVNNLAITGANRYPVAKLDRCFFEFTNFSKIESELNAIIKSEDGKKVFDLVKTTLAPMGVKRSILNLSDQNSPICAEIIAKNDFALDNFVCLSSVKKEPVKTAIRVKNKSLASLLKYTIDATELGFVVEENEDLLITDYQDKGAKSPWQFIIHAASEAVLLNGVVSLERQHPLCLGLPAINTLWSVDPNFRAEGSVLMSAGAVTLLSVDSHSEGSKKIFFNMNFDYSDLDSTSLWPIFFCNLFSWYQDLKNPLVKDKTTSRTESSFLGLSSSELLDDILSETQIKNFISVKCYFVIAALLLLALHQWFFTIRRRNIVY